MLGRFILSASARSPIGCAMLCGGCKMGGADLAAQIMEHRRREREQLQLDWQRCRTFCAFGALQLGCISHLIFTRLHPVLFPYSSAFVCKSLPNKMRDTRGLLTVIGMTFFQELVVTPTQTLPAFYIFRQWFQGTESEASDIVSTALATYSTNFVTDNLQSIKIFLPCNLINFLLMPARLRAVFATGVGAIWAVVLSASRGSLESMQERH